MRRREHLVDLVEPVLFDEFGHLDPAVQHEFEVIDHDWFGGVARVVAGTKRVDAVVGSTPQSLARVYAPNSQQLAFSPDGSRLAFMQGLEIKFHAYIADRLFVIPVAGGEPEPLHAHIDDSGESWVAEGRPVGNGDASGEE